MREPTIDGRDAESLREWMRQTAPYYTPGWDPDTGDAGAALLYAFAEMAADVTERLDRVPRKQFVSFLDTLGFDRAPPQPSRLPLTVAVDDGVASNVPVPAGTRATADADDGRPEQVFEIGPGDGFEATPARLRRVYSVDPSSDRIFEHSEALATGEETTLFGEREEENLQEHALHIGHADLLTLDPGSTVRVELTTETPRRALEALTWEYYGTSEQDGETTEGWHPLWEARVVRKLAEDLTARLNELDYDVATVDRSQLRAAFTGYVADVRDEVLPVRRTAHGETDVRDFVLENVASTRGVDVGLFSLVGGAVLEMAAGPDADSPFEPSEEVLERPVDREPAGRSRRSTTTTLRFTLPGETVQTTVGGVESRWIRCKLPTGADGERVRDALGSADPFDIELAGVSLGVEPRDLQPDELLYNDVPLVTEDDEGEPLDVYPFGDRPRPPDALYVASEEAFTKEGTEVHVAFEPVRETAVTFREQSTDGTAVLVDSATLRDGGFVAVYDADRLADGAAALEGVLSDDRTAGLVGVSAYMEAGTHEDVEVGLFGVPGSSGGDRTRLDRDQTLLAVAHRDTDGDETFDFAASGGSKDVPYLESPRGGPVLDAAAVEVERAEREPSDAGDEPTEAGETGEPTERATLRFRDQTADGRTVTVDRVGIPERSEGPEGAFVAVYGLRRGVIPAVVGVSERLEPGTHEDVVVELGNVPEGDTGRTDGGRPLEYATTAVAYPEVMIAGGYAAGGTPVALTGEQTLIAMLHADTNANGEFDFVGSDGTADGPYGAEGEAPVFDAAYVTFDAATAAAPRLSWEYWDGNGWALLEGLRDETNRLQGAGSVSFTVPPDLEATTVSGHDGRWIRARIVSGEYVTTTYVPGSGGGMIPATQGDPPRFGGVRVRYDETNPPEHLIAGNSLGFGVDLAESALSAVRPFARLPDRSQTLYLGFDRALDGGPIQLFVSVRDRRYPERFEPRIRWEYRRHTWARADARDGTASLTRRGIVRLTFPDPTVADERFGESLHWIRARVTDAESAFVPVAPETPDGPVALGAATATQRETSVATDGGAETGERAPCGASLETESATGPPSRAPPTVRGLYPNTGWATNVRSVEGERLGGSDGTPDQTFTTSAAPVTDATLWVDELAGLTDAQRRALEADRSADAETERDGDGAPTAVWVRWHRVDDLLESGGDDRHYVLDAATGRVTFGDGFAGRIPPRGRRNVRMDYDTGGGAAGNVPAGAVESLQSSIAFVDEVTNPEAADGGADEESTDGVLSRGPRQLRDRGRAVTATDVERVAASASRKLARVRCVPGLDDAGERSPGWVTLLVVPRGGEERPVPSAELNGLVERAVRERAPAALVGDGGGRLVVRGPGYVEATVTATLRAPEVESVTALETDATASAEAFLHPLSGGPAGDGWPFGTLPCLSDFYALFERLEGVDHVEDLSVTFRGSEGELTVREGDQPPSVAVDALVCSGEHDVRVVSGRPDAGSGGGVV